MLLYHPQQNFFHWTRAFALCPPILDERRGGFIPQHLPGQAGWNLFALVATLESKSLVKGAGYDTPAISEQGDRVDNALVSVEPFRPKTCCWGLLRCPVTQEGACSQWNLSGLT